MIEFIIDGERGAWNAGSIIEPPAIERLRIRQLAKLLRRPIEDTDGMRSVIVEHEGGIIEIIEELPTVEPGTEAHFRAVVRAMGGTII